MADAATTSLLAELWQRLAEDLRRPGTVPLWLAATVVTALACRWRPREGEFAARAGHLLAGLLAVAALYHAIELAWVGDDAFISFRYARNLVEGHGLVFNPGERVEGYTNFLWTVLVAAGLVVRLDPVSVALGLSLTSLAALVALVWHAGRCLDPDAPVLSPAALLLAGSALMASYGTSGLETMFAAALAFGALVAVLHDRHGLAGLLGIAATLSHPDHLLYYAALGIAFVADPRTLRRPWRAWTDRALRARVARYLAPLLLVFVPYVFARWAYYGDPFPNTYYAKSGHLTHFEQGGKYLLISLFATGTLVALPLGIAGAIANRRHIFGRYLLLVLVVVPLYCAKIGGDFMLGRLVVALLPPLFLGCELALTRLARARRGRLLAPLLLAGALLAVVPNRVVRPLEIFHGVADEGSFYRVAGLRLSGVTSSWPDSANALARHFRSRGYQPSYALANIGMAGWFSRLPIVDVLGLADREVAHMPITLRGRPGHEKGARPPYLVQRQVDFLDAPAYPAQWADLTRVQLGGHTYFLTGYRPSLIRALAGGPGTTFTDAAQHLESYLAAPPVAPEWASCDAWFYDLYFFQHNPAPELRARFAARLAPLLGLAPEHAGLLLRSNDPEWAERGRTLFDFEDVSGFEVVGAAFAQQPVRGLVPDQGHVHGHEGAYVNSYLDGAKDVAVGTLTSPPFVLEGDLLTLELGGGSRAVGAELLVDDQVIWRGAGCDAEFLGRRVIPVAEHRGQSARLRLYDRNAGAWGHVLADSLRIYR